MSIKRIDINYDVLCPNYSKNLDVDKIIGIDEMKRQEKVMEAERLDKDKETPVKKDNSEEKTFIAEVSDAKTLEEAKKLLVKRLNVI